MTSNNSNGGVHAAATLTGDLTAIANTVQGNVQAVSDYIFNKDSNETEIPDDVDVGVPKEGGETNTGPDDGQDVASESGKVDVAAPSAVSSASLLTSSMVGIAAVTTAFVAIA